MTNELPYHVAIEETTDGSKTLFVPELNEHYHSVHGALTESEYIFVEHALIPRLLSQPALEEYSVVEIGFGTGLNALLTFRYLQQHSPSNHITYHTYEKYPIDIDLATQLFGSALSSSEAALCTALHDAPWDKPVAIAPFFTLHKHLGDATQMAFPPFDVLYMDAFSPENAPDLWSLPFLQRLSDAARPYATYSTYCAKGAIRRMLQGLGWETVRTPGPPGGKREILTATKRL